MEKTRTVLYPLVVGRTMHAFSEATCVGRWDKMLV